MNTIPLTFAFIAAFLNAKNENGPVAKAWRLGRNQLVRSRSGSDSSLSVKPQNIHNRGMPLHISDRKVNHRHVHPMFWFGTA
jgi:hypothetical protein